MALEMPLVWCTKKILTKFLQDITINGQYIARTVGNGLRTGLGIKMRTEFKNCCTVP